MITREIEDGWMEMSACALRRFCGSVLPGLAERDRRRVIGELVLSLGWGGRAGFVAADLADVV